jgi:glycosyltransferase involved in cell wall biosynthesis
MRRLRILHVTSTPRGMGGVERLLVDMAPHYDLTQFDVRHCNLFDATGGEGPFPRALKATGLAYVGIEGERWSHLPLVARSLRAMVREQAIDILHLHMAHATVLAGLVGRANPGTKLIVSKHYTYEMIESAPLKMLDAWATNGADAVTAVSHYVGRDLLSHGTRAERMRVIWNGIDLAGFDRRSEQPARPVRREPDDLLIGCAGNLHPRKGHRYIVGAMPAVLHRFPNARLIIWGDGEDRGNLDGLSRSLGVNHAIDFLGFSENVPAALGQIDLLVQPSLQEAFGIVILEAMAAARPVVGTRVGGIPEIIVDGTTGRLVNAQDSEAMARAICWILEDANRRTELGRSGRARVEEEFQIGKTVKAYERLYSDLGSERLTSSA